ncbi:MAG TPA: FAD-dependent oxidoreductase [Acidimicrobiales bacterium]
MGMPNSTPITVVGGGIAGLVAAISAAEAGARVDLHEAHAVLGGRARSSLGPYIANLGPHAIYSDGPLWSWLKARDLLPPCAQPPLSGLRFRRQGELRRSPGPLLRALPLLWHSGDVPAAPSLAEWVGERAPTLVADALCRFMAVATFTADPGALAASFGVERAKRVLRVPSAARYVRGGWTVLVDRLAEGAARLGVRIHLQSPVDRLPEGGPVVVATELDRARRLLDDDSLRWPSGRVGLLDIGLVARGSDPFIVSDLDGAGWAERFSQPDPTLAPTGHSLVQVQVGLRGTETLEDGVRRAEALLDCGFGSWRERETWRRRSLLDGSTGALDLPGTSWRDRPPIDRGDGVFLCGDSVAAPGLLSEVAWASATSAGRAAVHLTATRQTGR